MFSNRNTMNTSHVSTCCFCFVTVPTSEIGMLQRFGKFNAPLDAGLHCIVPCSDIIAGTVSIRLQELEVQVDTKTKDNVFVSIRIAVQYIIEPQDAYNAFYKLTEPAKQIKSYVEDVVRAEVPTITLDSLFETKDKIASSVSESLNEKMKKYGFGIERALVTDIDPAQNVKVAMNEINAAQRLRVAALEKAEAEKIKVVKAAEAEAESKYLQGKGVARQREAIIDGLRESISLFSAGVKGATSQDAMNLVILTQYFDALRDIGSHSRTSTIFVPTGPGAVADLASQVRNGLLQGRAASTVDE